MSEMNNNQRKSENQARTAKRGFASMEPSKQREIASKGGKAAHMQGVAHEWTPEEARTAGRKGGEAVSKNKDHMSEIGRKGGEASHAGNRENERSEEE
jgi:general stress protein YciG